MCMRLSPCDSGSSGILFVGFNQDYGCFAVGMQNGFRIFNTDPLKQLERYEFDIRDGTGVGYLEMLFRTNLLGVLGGGYHSRLPHNVACLWDGVKQRFLLEFTCAADVKAIRLTHDRIVIVLLDAIKVYTFSPSSQLIYETKTCLNPLGLCDVSQNSDNPLIVFPSRRFGSVLLIHIGSNVTTTLDVVNLSNIPSKQIKAHENALASLSLNRTGQLLATASQKGTLIRIFSTKDCTLLHELRRGTNQATITCISFSKDSDMLCVTSERGTAHIFCLNKDVSPNSNSLVSSSSGSSSGLTSASSIVSGGAVAAASPSSSSKSAIIGNQSPHSLGSGKRLPKKVSNKLIPRSLFCTGSQVRCILETKFKAICAFSVVNPYTLIVLAADGSYYKYTFTINGSVTRVTFVNFLDFYDDEADF